MADKKHTEGQGDGGVFDEHEVQDTHEALDTELVGDDDTPDEASGIASRVGDVEAVPEAVPEAATRRHQVTQAELSADVEPSGESYDEGQKTAIRVGSAEGIRMGLAIEGGRLVAVVSSDGMAVGESTPLRGHCNALTGRVVVLEKQMDRLSLAIYGLASFVFGLLVGSWFFIHWLKLR